MMDRRIGVQIYTIEKFIQTEKDFAESMHKLREIGYQTIQISGVGPLSAKFMRAAADDAGLDIVCTHRSPKDFLEDLPGLIKFHEELRCPMAGIGCMPENMFGAYENIDELKNFIKTFNDIAIEMKKNGMTFGYHNHCFEFKKIEGKWMMDYLLEETDPEAFCFIPDTCWMAVAGVNPAKYIKKMGPRAKVVHFKDLQMSAWTTPGVSEVMEGNLDWDEIIAACDDAGSECAVVEQDKCPADPFDSLRISYNNLKTKGFN